MARQACGLVSLDALAAGWGGIWAEQVKPAAPLASWQPVQQRLGQRVVDGSPAPQLLGPAPGQEGAPSPPLASSRPNTSQNWKREVSAPSLAAYSFRTSGLDSMGTHFLCDDMAACRGAGGEAAAVVRWRWR